VCSIFLYLVTEVLLGKGMSRREYIFEKLLSILPGFRGYRKKEYVREDDKLVREYLVKVLTEAVRDLEDAIANIAEYDFKTAELFDNTLRDLRTAADKIRWAEHGYSPHFNIVKVREEDLAKMRDIDSSLVENVEKIRDFVSDIKKESLLKNPVRDKVQDLVKLLDDVKVKLVEREKVLKGWSLG